MAAAATTDATSAANPQLSRLVLGLLTGIALIISFSESMLIPALPIIGKQYGAPPSEVAWVSAAYLLVGSSTVLVIGKLGDMFGRKRLLIIVMAIYSIAATLNGVSWSIPSLVAFRGLQGVGLAMYPLAFALIHDETPPERVPIATGLVSGMNSAGAIIGLVGGAWITEQFGWQANYWILGPSALVLTALLAYFAIESRQREREGIDFLGAGLFAIGIGLLLFGLTEGGEVGFGSPIPLSAFIVGGALIAIFVYHEFRARTPLMNLRLPGIGTMLKTAVLMAVAGASLYLGFESVIYFAQGPPPGLQLGITDASIILLPAAALMIVFTMFAGVLMRRRGVRLPEFIGLLLLVAGFSSLLVFHSTEAELALAVIPVVAGVAMLFNSTVNATMVLAPPEKVATQNGVLIIFENVSQAVAAAIAGAALVAFADPITHLPTGTAYATICGVGLGLAAVGLIVFARLPQVLIPTSSSRGH